MGSGRFYIKSGMNFVFLMQKQIQPLWRTPQIMKDMVYIQNGRVYDDLQVESNISGTYIKSATGGRVYKFYRG
jgi:hypothetical protein